MLFTRRRHVLPAIEDTQFGKTIRMYDAVSSLDYVVGVTSISQRLIYVRPGAFTSKVFFGVRIGNIQGVAAGNNSREHRVEEEREIPYFHTTCRSKLIFSLLKTSVLRLPFGSIEFRTAPEQYGGGYLLGYLLRRTKCYLPGNARSSPH